MLTFLRRRTGGSVANTLGTGISVVKEKLEWLAENEEASADEFNSAKKDIEEIVQPIIASLYQHSNSQGHGEEEL